MLVELGNVVGGFKLGAPMLGRVVPPLRGLFGNLEEIIKPWHTGLGWYTLIAGVLTILVRVDVPVPVIEDWFHAGYPQGVLSTAVGLVMLKDNLRRYPGIYHLAGTLGQFGSAIGLLALAAALYRLI